MRTTLILDDELLEKAKALTGLKEKTAVVHARFVVGKLAVGHLRFRDEPSRCCPSCRRFASQIMPR